MLAIMTKHTLRTPMRFITEQERIRAHYPSRTSGRKEWITYAGNVKSKARVATDFLLNTMELLTEDNKISFSVAQARAHASGLHGEAAYLRIMAAVMPLDSVRFKGERLREQYDTLVELIQDVFRLLGEDGLIDRFDRAM
jgi:hypothetical protein